jgi:dTDP-4-dehydrorhamnose reductase
MDHAKIILTGGSGLLGTEFKKNEPEIIYPAHAEFDITDFEGMRRYMQLHPCELIIHAAAATSPPLVEKDPVKALQVNIIGTANVVRLCRENNIKLIYICTDYVFRGDQGNYKEDDAVFPVNKYAWSKLGGECAVRLYENSIIVRTTFGANVFPYEKAFVDQWTSRESVAVIARKIARLVDTEFKGVIHIGGDRKTVYEYATRLDPTREIKELSVRDVTFKVPIDTSLNCEKYGALIG